MMSPKINPSQPTHTESVLQRFFSKRAYGMSLIFLLSVVSVVLLRDQKVLETRQGVAQEKSLKYNMPLTLESATSLAEQKINEQSKHSMIIKDVKEIDTGWIFYYDSKEATETRNQEVSGVPGNVPLYINTDGSMKYLPNPNDPLLRW